jgi:hypothetical protein
MEEDERAAKITPEKGIKPPSIPNFRKSGVNPLPKLSAQH